jgi:alpha-N-acetylglucosaminidase
MLELGMTPVLPAFTGFVPQNISRVFPNANVVRGSEWNGFGDKYSNVTFLEPFDGLFQEVQGRLLEMQRREYGDVGDVLTLDQYNENIPWSGDLSYLRQVSKNTMASLRSANPDAVWLMQVLSGGLNLLGMAVLRST